MDAIYWFKSIWIGEHLKLKKKLSKVNCEINSVDMDFLVDSDASVNIINI